MCVFFILAEILDQYNKDLFPQEDEYVLKMYNMQQLQELQMGGPGGQTLEATPSNPPVWAKPDAPMRPPIGLKRFEKSPTKKFPKRKLEFEGEDVVRSTRRPREQDEGKKEGVTHVVELMNHNFSKQVCFLVQTYDKESNEVILRETFGPKKIPNYLSRVMKANPKKCNEIASKMFNLLSKYDFK